MAAKWQRIGIYVALAAFGVAYNQVVEKMEEAGNEEQVTSLLVAFGTAVTVVLSIPLIGKSAARQLFISFIASGSPMILGQLLRYHRRKKLVQ